MRRIRLVPLFGAVVQPIRAFFALEAASGLLLLASAIGALAWVNLGGAALYESALRLPLTLGAGEFAVRFTLHELVNDGLMTLFFFVVGLEIKRELVLGELASPARATLPAIAALGGMLVPALIFLAFNRGGPGQAGWGIPMATDIAFCIGVLTLLKSRVPHGLIVFVTALAIFDDIGGILVIALFYGQGLEVRWLAGALALVLVLAAMGRAHVASALAWTASGALLWVALHHGGIHPTITGVLVGLAVPARVATPPQDTLRALASHLSTLVGKPSDLGLDGQVLLSIERALARVESPLDRFLHRLNPCVAFGIMPVFALANSGADLRSMDLGDITGAVTLGTAVGLLAGKMVGILVFTAATVKLGFAPMPGSASYAKLLGAATVAGIGFTVALFIAGLAYPVRPDLLSQAKVGILAGSLAAGLLGGLFLRLTSRVEEARDPQGTTASAQPA